MRDVISMDQDGDTEINLYYSDGSDWLLIDPNYIEAVEFLANSWWRSRLITLISGGRIKFTRE